MPLQTFTYNRIKYFVDYRMQQFRSDTDWIEFIDFTSEKGDRILAKMIKDGVADLTRIKL